MRSIAINAAVICAVAIGCVQYLMAKQDGDVDFMAMVRGERPASAPQSPSHAKPQAALAYSGGSGDVAVAAGNDGHFRLDARISGANIPFLVDTGASTVVLRQSDAERAGHRFSRSDFSTPVNTANGTTYAAQTTLREVRVGTIRVDNVRALVLPDDILSSNLLGMSFMSKLRRFEFESGRLYLEN